MFYFAIPFQALETSRYSDLLDSFVNFFSLTQVLDPMIVNEFNPHALLVFRPMLFLGIATKPS